jgi:hypothetical protein
MWRSMRRVGTIVAVAHAAAFATALPAFAKGEVIPVHVTASVTGRGLATPVAIRWGGDCPFPEYCGSNGSAKGLDGFSFLNSTGVLGRATPSYFGPARSLLGPKYEITYRVVSRGVVMTAHQDLYPFGPGTSQYDPQRPWLYAQPGQRLFTGMLPGGWILAPTSLVSILRDHGFHVPAPAPTGFPTAPQPQTVAKAPSPQPDGPAPWALGLGALALAGMVVGGAIVGRGRSAKRAMRPAATR